VFEEHILVNFGPSHAHTTAQPHPNQTFCRVTVSDELVETAVHGILYSKGLHSTKQEILMLAYLELI
jgi:hypothetical protein